MPIVKSSILHPVIMPVPAEVYNLRGPEKSMALSFTARQALKHSAKRQDMILEKLEKDASGAPVPHNGIYWSLSHTNDYVAAVASRKPVGIDIEKIAPFPASLPQQIATKSEWALESSLSPLIFYRFWTAKEAVLKATGIGLSGLSDCKIIQNIGPKQIKLRLRSKTWSVTNNFEIPQHVISLTSGDFTVKWHLALN